MWVCDDRRPRGRCPPDASLRDAGHIPESGQRSDDHDAGRGPRPVRVRPRLGPDGRPVPRPRPLLHRLAVLAAAVSDQEIAPSIAASASAASGRLGVEWTSAVYPPGMCRSIKVLRRPDEPATTGEIEAAARQFVRKVSGYRTPSARNTAAFDAAIAEVAAVSRR